MNRLSTIILAMILLSATAAAQQRPARPQTPPRPPASDFNLEMINFEGPSRIEAVPGGGTRAGYINTGKELRRVPDWKSSADPISEVAAVKVDFSMEEGAVRVKVIAYVGKGEGAPNLQPADLKKLKEVTVATRLVHENETVTVNETEQFGIQAIGFKVLRTNPWSIGPPEITNKTQALNVTAISEERPAFMVTAKNVSHQCIIAIRWYGIEGGHKGGASGLSAKCLISAGGVFNFRQQFALNPREEGENVQPRLPEAREIVIAMVLFDDGTFEGDIDSAAAMAAHLTGVKIQRARVLQLLQDAAAAPVEDRTQTLAKLKTDTTSLSEEVGEAITTELTLRFTGAAPHLLNGGITEDVRNGLRMVKNDLLQRIERFEYERAHSPETADFGAWLKENKMVIEGTSSLRPKN